MPNTISREQYAAIRADKAAFPAWMVGAAGFLLQAVILPQNVIEESFVDRLSELAALTEETFNKQRPKGEREEMPGQVALNVDPATGEVV